MKEKILHIAPYYLPQYGGTEQVTHDIINILKDSYENKIICFSETGKTFINEYEGIEVHRIGWIKKISSQAISFSYFFRLYKLLKKYNPNYIHLHLPNPLITVYLLICLFFIKRKINIIGHWHSDIVEQKIIKKFYNPVQNILLKKLDKIIVTSKEYGNKSKDLKNYKEKLVIIPNIVNEKVLNNFNTKEIEKIKVKYKAKKIIFFIGVHRKYKGLQYLVEASRYLPNNYKIIIAGKGPLTETLKESSKDDSKIEFIGRITDEEKVNYYYASDVFAFPSITKNEAFGVALAEALYCGLPAVTFTIDGSGVNWVNKDNYTGIEVREKKAEWYAKALIKVIDNKEFYGLRCKTWILENFIENRIKEKVFRLYEENSNRL